MRKRNQIRHLFPDPKLRDETNSITVTTLLHLSVLTKCHWAGIDPPGSDKNGLVFQKSASNRSELYFQKTTRSRSRTSFTVDAPQTPPGPHHIPPIPVRENHPRVSHAGVNGALVGSQRFTVFLHRRRDGQSLLPVSFFGSSASRWFAGGAFAPCILQ